MLSWLDIAVQQERYRDFMREAEPERLLRTAKEPTQSNHHFYSQALIWLGQRLVAWGLSLQKRFNATAPAPVSQPAHFPC
jgi:hypothetical protein